MFVKDKKILFELDHNCRQTNAQIAKKVGLSKQVVGYRINRLIEKGILTNFRTIINCEKLGQIYHNILIKMSNFNKKTEKEFIDYISGCDFVTWHVKAIGEYDYIISILSRNIVEFNKQFGEILSKFGEYISDDNIFTIFEAYKLDLKYLIDKKESLPNQVYADKIGSKSPVDDLDLDILKLLDNDARIPSTKIAEKLGIRQNQVFYRMKRLQKSGVIQGFNAIFDVAKTGYSWHIVLFKLNHKSQEREKQFLNYLRNHKYTVYIVHGIGFWNLMVDLHVKDAIHLNEILNDFRSEYGDVIKTFTTLMIPEVYKSRFFSDSISMK